jgi:ABC-type multidrug transport system fused ATPase/permease subunit
VLEQTKQGVPISQVIARSSLSRELVDFFERDIPLTITAAISFLGAIGMLFLYDWQIGFYCLFLLIPVSIINKRYGRLSLRLNQGLNDRLEREVDILTQQDSDEICHHYRLLNKWRIRLSDAEAKNWGMTTLLLGGLVVAVLIRAIALPNIEAGDIYTIVTYAMNFTFSLDDVPFLVQQLSRLKDISHRVNWQLEEV